MAPDLVALVAVVVWLAAISNAEPTTTTKPHIIVIMADDLGFDDVGFHGSDQIPTPNIDALAAFGVALNRYYVAPMCTPSRSSLLSGKYPSHVGMQHFVIPSEQPYGLGLDQKLLPEYMREGGYRTHIVGKWHLGFYMKRYTPTQRGFDSHFGYLGPYIDYYNHSLLREHLPWPFASGYDMRSNLSFAYDTVGKYATDLFTDVAVDTIDAHPKHLPLFLYLAHLAPHAANEYDPMQVPADELAKFAYIADPARRRYAAMVSRMDAGIGRVVEAMRANAMLDNAVILFCSDNGAPVQGMHSNAGSNYPFKGQKDSPWEGAVRSAAAIWSPLLKQRQRTSDQLFHISDWLPTFAHLAGVKVQRPIDGHNIWGALTWNTNSPRTAVLCSLDEIDGYSALVRDDWKLVNGSSSAGQGQYDTWLSGPSDAAERPADATAYGERILRSPAGRALLPYSFSLTAGHGVPLTADHVEQLRGDAVVGCRGVPVPAADDALRCRPLESPCLFNVVEDPCERRNLAAARPEVLQSMQLALEVFRKSAMCPRNRPSDERSNPENFNGTWTWWYDELGLPDHSSGGVVRVGGLTSWLASAAAAVMSWNWNKM